MFDSERYAVRRPVDPPRAVLVDLLRLLPPTRIRWGTNTPLWARAQGLQVGRPVPAVLTEWVITECGDWAGRCLMTVVVGGESLDLDVLVPAAAIKPQQP